VGKFQSSADWERPVLADTTKLRVSSKKRCQADALPVGQSEHLCDYRKLDEALAV